MPTTASASISNPTSVTTRLRWGHSWSGLLGQEPPPPPGPNLAELADELLVDVEFLKDIVELLKDKGQVILYGPPGTGKTYLARELAKTLAPDDSCRALVQVPSLHLL